MSPYQTDGGGGQYRANVSLSSSWGCGQHLANVTLSAQWGCGQLWATVTFSARWACGQHRASVTLSAWWSGQLWAIHLMDPMGMWTTFGQCHLVLLRFIVVFVAWPAPYLAVTAELWPWSWFSIRMTSYHLRNPLIQDQTVITMMNPTLAMWRLCTELRASRSQVICILNHFDVVGQLYDEWCPGGLWKLLHNIS